jgi:hypothetical protein
MFIVLGVAILFAIRRQLDHPYLVLSLVFGAIILSPYMLWPRRLRRTQWISADPTHEPIDPRGPDVPSEVAATTTSAVEGLAPLGFSVKYAYRTRDLIRNGTAYAVLFENESGDVAKLIVSEVSGAARQVSIVLVYTSEFADGTEIHTTNSRSPSLYPPPSPPAQVFTLPQANGAASLYAIHRALVARFGGDGPRLDHLRGGLVGYLRRTKEQSHKRMIATGYYYLDETGRLLRPTWKGATLMAWKLLWPIKQIRGARRRHRAERLLQSLDLGVSEV